MKNFTLVRKIIIIDCSIIIFIGIITGFFSAADGFAFALGIICLLGGLLNLLLGIIARIASSEEWAKGFLISCGLLLLLSGISCGTGLAYNNY